MSRRDDVTRSREKLHNEELNDLYYSPNILRVIKSRKMRLVGHVAHMGRRELCTGFWWGDLVLEGRIILRRIFRKWDMGIWTGSSWLRIGTVGGDL